MQTLNEQFEAQQLEIEQLKAQVNKLLKCGNLMKVNLGYSSDTFSREYIALWNKVKDKTPEQCLNSVKADAIRELINEMGTCDHKDEDIIYIEDAELHIKEFLNT